MVVGRRMVEEWKKKHTHRQEEEGDVVNLQNYPCFKVEIPKLSMVKFTLNI